MGKTTGFMEFDRELPQRRPIPLRVEDWDEVYDAVKDGLGWSVAAAGDHADTAEPGSPGSRSA